MGNQCCQKEPGYALENPEHRKEKSSRMMSQMAGVNTETSEFPFLSYDYMITIKVKSDMFSHLDLG